jgi:hypothetical protein
MAIPPEQNLTRDQIAQFILDPGEAVKHIQKVWGKAVPDDMWELLYHLGTVLAVTRKEISDVRLRAFSLAQIAQKEAAQLDAAEIDLNKLQEQYDSYFVPLNNQAMQASPLIATQDWIRMVRAPMVFGQHPETGAPGVPWAALPFRTLHMVVEHASDFPKRLADPGEMPFAVFEKITRVTKGLGERLEEEIEEVKEKVTYSLLPWLLLGGVGVYLFTRR